MRFPKIDDVAAELRRINKQDAEDGDDEGIDVRLQVYPDGDWAVRWGLSDYDQDHRGFWGSASVPGNNRRFDSKALARDLIDQAKEAKATGGDDDLEESKPAHVRSTRATESRKTAKDDDEISIANPGEMSSDKTLYQFQFGTYASDPVYVWSGSNEDAFEIAVEWADENVPGAFTTVTEDDLKEAAEDLDIEWQPHWPDWDDPKFERVVQAAEADLTVIGHTQLKSGTHIHSDEWHFHEVTDETELAEIAVASFEEDGSDMLNIDYHSEGPDEDEPTSGLDVSRNGGFIDITEWTDVYAATGEPEAEGDILRQDARVDIYELLDPKGKHRGTYSRDEKQDLGEILLMDERDQEDAVVAAAISWMAYFGGEESHVSYIGE